MNLTREDREIAIRAIAARASGDPVRAAEEILKGIAALDAPGEPFVIWPRFLGFDEQIKVLEQELKSARAEAREQAERMARLATGDQSYANPVSAARPPTPAEIETLQALISESLIEVWSEGDATLTVTATAFAKAVRAAFEETYKPATPACSVSHPRQEKL